MLRPVMMILFPRSASCLVSSMPMPLEPPVIKMVFPFSFIITSKRTDMISMSYNCQPPQLALCSSVMSMGTVSQIIGQTPLIKITSLSELTGCEVYGKAEFLNPGGSVKDRTALGIIEAAEKSGQLKPGYTIVEGTAGNTGIGLAT